MQAVLGIQRDNMDYWSHKHEKPDMLDDKLNWGKFRNQDCNERGGGSQISNKQNNGEGAV